MNKRIKELANKAGYSKDYLEIGLPSNMEKFAELIVQECAKVCDLYAMPDGTNETAIILASAIRRKFGVE